MKDYVLVLVSAVITDALGDLGNTLSRVGPVLRPM